MGNVGKYHFRPISPLGLKKHYEKTSYKHPNSIMNKDWVGKRIIFVYTILANIILNLLCTLDNNT